MDDLKKYLQQNREQMDKDTPSAELLQRIQKHNTAIKKSKFFKMLVRVSAAACIVAAVFLGVQFLSKQHNQVQPATVKIIEPAVPGRLPLTTTADTVQQLVKVGNNPAIAQQKKERNGKQVPISYRLLNSFELNYNKLVKLQLKNIRSTPVYGETQDYFNGFKKRMQQISEDEAALKLNIKTNGLSDELLEQLVNLYQEKINVLKSLQQEIGSMNNKIKENRQPADSIPVFYINI